MKLSKKNQARQRAIRKAIASGKSVGGLLAGALALATTGCSPKPSPGPIGRFPDRRYEEQAGRKANNESPRRVPMGDVPNDQPTPPSPKPKTPPLVHTTGEVPPCNPPQTPKK
jgi:hypothetical protein